MNQVNQTIKKVETILTSKYDAKNFEDLIREIFPSVKIVAPGIFHKEYTNFSSHIEGSYHIGNYIDPDNKKLIIHAVRLKKESYVENSRSTQRSYAKKLIEAGNADAAIIAFFTDGDPKWRLSFVRLDYEIKFENGKLNTAENMTPAKRYSYLVGQDEPCHTAISRFRRFIIDDPDVAQPSLDDLEEAFSVEKVTEEFFNLYCEKFHQLRESLEANPDFVIEAEQHNFTSAQFAKKLMGQIVFLYFLQKKGWLGVSAWPKEMNAKEYKKAFFARGAKSRELIPRVYVQVNEDLFKLSGRALNELSDEDETVLASCVKGNAWGTGSKTFMRTLFEFSQRREANFFDDFLEPLFYDALNVNRGEQGYDPALHCRIPFLSGGLFEPIDGYDWKHNDFAIPNEVFSNRAEKGERDADGILDIFDRYNFTMSEDEPLEREVAIDPEMLGKVFENLLDVEDRKSKGAFYTPREIVHYMCQESLISYLTKETGLKEQDIRDFILLGDFLKDEDTAKEKRRGEHDMLISEEIFKIDRNGKVIVDRLKEIDDALENIRVADPAVGSGAFPLGMLNEIVRARQNISAYMAITMDAYHTRMMYNNARSPYFLKLQTIKNCIFAADVEPSAVDITQLRLWLALVIDDEINPEAQNPLDGHKNPIPLPNLDCNIICGNSLVDEFEGIKLINQNDTLGTGARGQQQNQFQAAFDAVLPSLLEAQDALFSCDNTEKKQELKNKIEALKDEIVKTQMQMDNTGAFERYLEARSEASRPFLLWQIDFARVFRDKGGFDIVIGNPPYLESRSPNFSDELKDQLQNIIRKRYGKNADWFSRGSDLLIYFFELSLRLINSKGINTFITQNSWLSTEYGKKFQSYLLNNTDVVAIIDSDYKYFETADINTVITFMQGKSGQQSPLLFARCHRNLKNYSVPANAQSVFDNDAVSVKVLPPDSELLRNMKWGFIFDAEDTLVSIIDSVNSKGKTIDDMPGYSIGQGLNLKKSAVFSANDINYYSVPNNASYPFFVTEEGGVYCWTATNHYLVDKQFIDDNLIRKIGNEHDLFDSEKTRKVPPALIMPRGIGARHFCCYNSINGFSASCVDLYAPHGIEITDDIIRLWLYMNSSLFWLIRETVGRTNLGGGMLKAEAVDLKPFAILFPITITKEVKALFESAKGVVISNAQDEICTSIHMAIDKVVYDYLGLSDKERDYVNNLLTEKINARYNKTKSK